MYLKQQTWNVSDIKRQIHRIATECKSPYNEGFTSFELKKELYDLQFLVDTALRSCPTFAGEEEWIQIQKQNRLLKHLKD